MKPKVMKRSVAEEDHADNAVLNRHVPRTKSSAPIVKAGNAEPALTSTFNDAGHAWVSQSSET